MEDPICLHHGDLEHTLLKKINIYSRAVTKHHSFKCHVSISIMFSTEGHFGSLLHKFQFPATHHCHSPTIPGTDYTTEMPGPSIQNQTSWKHLTESKKQTKTHPQTKPRKSPACCSLRKGCSTCKGMPDLTQHTIPLPCTSTTAKLIHWCLPKEGKSWSNHSHRDKETEK